MFKKLLIATVSLAVLTSYTYYKFSHKEQIQSLMDQQQLVRYYRQLKRQVFNMCITLYHQIKKIKETKPLYQIKQLSHQIQQMIKSKENLLIVKFNITKEALYKSTLAYYNNEIIQKIRKQILNDIENIYEGKLPDMELPNGFIEEYSMQMCINFLRDIYKNNSKQLLNNFTKIKEQNNIKLKMHSEFFLKQLDKLKFQEFRCDYLKQNKMDRFQGNCYENFYKLVQFYKFNSKQFLVKTIKIQKLYQEIIDYVLEESLKDYKLQENDIETCFQNFQNLTIKQLKNIKMNNNFNQKPQLINSEIININQQNISNNNTDDFSNIINLNPHQNINSIISTQQYKQLNYQQQKNINKQQIHPYQSFIKVCNDVNKQVDNQFDNQMKNNKENQNQIINVQIKQKADQFISYLQPQNSINTINEILPKQQQVLQKNIMDLQNHCIISENIVQNT